MRRHRVDFLVKTKETDEYGEKKDVWIPFKENVWASKEPIIGKEFYTALTTDQKVDAKFSTGLIHGVTGEMRLQHGTQVYEIIGEPLNIKDRNMEFLFYCRLVE